MLFLLCRGTVSTSASRRMWCLALFGGVRGTSSLAAGTSALFFCLVCRGGTRVVASTIITTAGW